MIKRGEKEGHSRLHDKTFSTICTIAGDLAYYTFAETSSAVEGILNRFNGEVGMATVKWLRHCAMASSPFGQVKGTGVPRLCVGFVMRCRALAHRRGADPCLRVCVCVALSPKVRPPSGCSPTTSLCAQRMVHCVVLEGVRAAVFAWATTMDTRASTLVAPAEDRGGGQGLLGAASCGMAA